MSRLGPALLVGGLLVLAGHAGAQELGRLFFTPEQRDALDARRKARVPDKPAAKAAPASPTTRFDGYVKRSGGPSTVWVDGEALSETPRERGGRVAVPIGEGGARVPLKPGEVLDRGSGEVKDVIGGGQITIRRGAP